MVKKTKDRYFCRTCKEYHYFKKPRVLTKMMEKIKSNEKIKKIYNVGKCENCGTTWWFKDEQ